MLNGSGLRVVLWVSGCNHHCPGCHNPITWDAEDGLDFDETAKEELFAELRKEYISGITFSGGDPLHEKNLMEITALAEEIKERFPDKNIWLYTGAMYEDIEKLPVFACVDVCVDGEFIEKEMDPKLLWKGSKNQRVIDVKESKKREKTILYCEDYEKELEDVQVYWSKGCCS